MGAIEEVTNENAPVEQLSASAELLLDAVAIEEAASKMTRIAARMHMESLAQTLRRDSEALASMEHSKKVSEQQTTEVTTRSLTTRSPTSVVTIPAVPLPAPLVSVTTSSTYYTQVDKFSFDAGGYNDPFVTLYVDLPGVGAIPGEKVTCEFTKDSVDLIVRDLNQKSYRLFKDNLEKEINPDKSKIIVKSQKVVVKLHKVKRGEYGSYDYWTQLTDKKSKSKSKKEDADNPQASIMQLMKDMYDEGDDNMKKVIGETMMKQRRGELGDGMGGMGGLGDSF